MRITIKKGDLHTLRGHCRMPFAPEVLFPILKDPSHLAKGTSIAAVLLLMSVL